MNLHADPELDNAMANKLQSSTKDLNYGKGLLEPDLNLEDLTCGFEQQQLCGPTELECSSISQQTMRAADIDVQNVRFETTHKHQRAVTK